MLTPNEITRVCEEWARGELTIGCYVETSQGRYQIMEIQHRSLVEHDVERPYDTRLTLVRPAVKADRVRLTIPPEYQRPERG